MIWVIAGTLDGRTLAVDVQTYTKESVLVSVVSQYGAQLAAHEGIEVHTGRLDKEAMKELIEEKDIRLLIDASHPYAAIVTATAREAADEMKIPFVRFERQEIPLPTYDKLYHVPNEAEAAQLAGTLGERIYLTTGSKTMHVFASAPALQDKEVWTRVLPTVEVLQMMEDLGISPKRIIGMQGPFSYDMNRIMFADTKADVVVMKNSGLVGGSDTKLQAAMDLGLAVVVIDRPKPAEGARTITEINEFYTLWEELKNGLH
ncbi:MAG: precorrin-6A reductase [Veillonella caviae]|nr:precorrin-6A reductase [Veillonella caviae]